MKCAIYARVSTSEQSTDAQLRELREYCQRRSWEVYREYVDHATSGATDSRPQLNELMKDARRRRFEAICVWRFDRFARSTKHLLLALEEFDSLNIAFVSHQEALDTSSAMGRAMFTIISALAELERNIIRDRVRSGIANARAKGTALGRPQRIFRRDEARRLRAEGLSWRAIAKELGVPVSTVVDGCTKNPSDLQTSTEGKLSTRALSA